MSVRLARQTLEYVLFPLDTAPVDPSILTHEVAVVPELDQPSGWVGVSWVGGYVQTLVSASAEAPPGGDFTLDVGRWRVWWRAPSNPEFPVRQVGVIQVV